MRYINSRFTLLYFFTLRGPTSKGRKGKGEGRERERRDEGKERGC